MVHNKLQFAITREDPLLEIELVTTFQSRSVLLVCSAGDTVLALKTFDSTLRLKTFDFNPVQIAHCKLKGKSPSVDLHTSGNFESLFRQWKLFFNEFVLSVEDTERLFRGEGVFLKEILTNKYWPVSFDLHFHDHFLEAMFSSAAIQHAPKGSYPRYFQRAFERGLAQEKYFKNPFLQHLFLGNFVDTPEYLQYPVNLAGVEFVHGLLQDIPDLNAFDLVQLSNIFDWSSVDEIRSLCGVLGDKLKPGSVVLIRQINNESPVMDFLGPRFTHLKNLSEEFLRKDRSLFYSNFIVAQRT